MNDLIQQQIDLEEQYSHKSILDSIKQTQTALDEGRASDTSIGKRIVAQAFSTTREHLEVMTKPRAGPTGKYRGLIRRVNLDTVTIASLRLVLGLCSSDKSYTLQDVCRGIGQLVEAEALIEAISEFNPVYADKTLGYLDKSKTASINHRSRTFNAAATSLKMGWEPWGAQERIGCGRLVMMSIYETGLFQWEKFYEGKGRIAPIEVIRPSEALAAHLLKAVESAKSLIRFPPMLVPPKPWVDPSNGGYLTDWYQQRAPIVSMKAPKWVRRWVYGHLQEGMALPLKEAMNKAQSVPYRVNRAALKVLGEVVASGEGLMGIARSAPEPKPEFPFLTAEKFDKETATPGELQEFKHWKNSMHLWHTRESTRVGQAAGLLGKLKELQKYSKYDKMYFPTFADWRGRIYFRSSLNPQSFDAVKGCIEFAEGKRLGKRGVFWLKVHIANCAGYDKHSPEIKEQWVDKNIEALWDFMENPLEVQAPEPDTAFTLYSALLAYRDALDSGAPEEYLCHIPVAMDATCSGLQHFSAMLHDEVGGKYTNLIDNGSDQKSDIYKHVGALADSMKHKYAQDICIADYWKGNVISRGMAKRPVMTYVYGSTLKSTIDYVSFDMQADGMPMIKDDDGKTLYSHHKLAVCVGKALRAAVAKTVPSAAAGMKFLQELVKASEEPLKWITPVGFPVVNWVEAMEIKKIKIRSMGREVAWFKLFTGEYNRRGAVSGVSPNFVHSMDSAHLCLTVSSTSIQVLPIHDSFATHPSDVDELHEVLRRTFLEMYQTDHLNKLLCSIVQKEGYDVQLPAKGSLKLDQVLQSRFMFC